MRDDRQRESPASNWRRHRDMDGARAEGGVSARHGAGWSIHIARHGLHHPVLPGLQGRMAEWPTFARTKNAMKARAAGAWHRPNGRGAGSGACMGLAAGLASHLHMAEEALDPWVFTGQQPGWWRIEQHAAAVHEQHAIGHAEGEAHLMRHDQYRHATER